MQGIDPAEPGDNAVEIYRLNVDNVDHIESSPAAWPLEAGRRYRYSFEVDPEGDLRCRAGRVGEPAGEVTGEGGELKDGFPGLRTYGLRASFHYFVVVALGD
jgi:hypothetical protein